jgi:hypothetical protein
VAALKGRFLDETRHQARSLVAGVSYCELAAAHEVAMIGAVISYLSPIHES